LSNLTLLIRKLDTDGDPSDPLFGRPKVEKKAKIPRFRSQMRRIFQRIWEANRRSARSG
jgi:hypothetical protein